MIQISNVRKTYRNGISALNGVSLSIKRGTTFSLLGPNGAGKSTLVRILATLSRSTSGLVSVDGCESLRGRKPLLRKIGVALQDVCLDPEETSRDILRFQGRLFGMKKTDAAHRADELIQLFQIEGEALKKIKTLSGGNKRRVHIALSLVHKPSILFLDEPTTGMDPESRAVFWESIGRLNREEKMTLFLTTQYLDEAEKHTTELALIMEGIIAYEGSVSDFKRSISDNSSIMSLEESYLRFLANYRLSKESIA
jgi:ABC-2 type transport system ATP-binding protein